MKLLVSFFDLLSSRAKEDLTRYVGRFSYETLRIVTKHKTAITLSPWRELKASDQEVWATSAGAMLNRIKDGKFEEKPALTLARAPEVKPPEPESKAPPVHVKVTSHGL